MHVWLEINCLTLVLSTKRLHIEKIIVCRTCVVLYNHFPFSKIDLYRLQWFKPLPSVSSEEAGGLRICYLLSGQMPLKCEINDYSVKVSLIPVPFLSKTKLGLNNAKCPSPHY